MTTPFKTKLNNESITVFSGEIKIFISNDSTSSPELLTHSKGVLTWDWSNWPHLSYKVSNKMLKPFSYGTNTKFSIEIPDIHFKGECTAGFKDEGDETSSYHGVAFYKTHDSAKFSPAENIQLHLPNVRTSEFGTYLDSTLKVNGYLLKFKKVAIDEDIIKEAIKNNGNLITHTCSITKENKDLITQEEYEHMYDLIYYTVSFVHKKWTCPVLSYSINSSELGWIDLRVRRLSSFNNREMDENYSSNRSLTKLMTNFSLLLKSQSWSKKIIPSLSWYIDSFKPNQMEETKVILSQVGLETISWIHFVVDPSTKKFTEKKFDDLKAHKRLRKLIELIKLPTKGYSTFPELEIIMSDDKIHDIISAYTHVRNQIEHPKSDKYNFPLVSEAASLGTFFLELSILYILNYQGAFKPPFLLPGDKFCRSVSVPWKGK